MEYILKNIKLNSLRHTLLVVILSLLFSSALQAQVNTQVEACEGQTVTLTATPINAGTSPTFQWVKNDVYIDNETTATYSYIPQNGDIVYCEVTSSDLCADPQTVTSFKYAMTVNKLTAPPSATTPQTFCEGATVANLQTINGVNVVWYTSQTGGTVVPAIMPLMHGNVYYAAQTNHAGCEGGRTAVVVVIDNKAVIEAPKVASEVELCIPATLADVPTDGNTNIVWYDQMTGGSKVDFDTPLDTDITLYAALEYGNGACFSTERTEVNIRIVNEISAPENMESPQYFCEGVLVGNLATPNNKIVWYSEEGDLLNPGDKLTQGIYYAAQQAGSCESADRTKVEVIISKYPAPVAPSTQTVCGKFLYISDLMITGAGIKWYDENKVEITSPYTTVAYAKKTYYATQTSGDCESEPTSVYIEQTCFSPMATVFPFVHTGNEESDNQFVTTAKLYAMPPATTLDKIGYIRKQEPILETRATYYDCTHDEPIVGAPKHPGTIGSTNNPGLPIRWRALGIVNPSTPNSETLTETDYCTTAPIGKFVFKNVAPGEYIIAIARQGFLTRYGVVNITSDDYLGHRELLGGDVNGDMYINEKDLSTIRSKTSTYGNKDYNWIYNLNGDNFVNGSDIGIISINFGATNSIYQETEDWINP